MHLWLHYILWLLILCASVKKIKIKNKLVYTVGKIIIYA